MPTVDQILSQLHAVANGWPRVAALWHGYAAVLLALVALGRCSSRRVLGVLLTLPLFSVSALAWVHANPFNGGVFALLGAALSIVALRLPKADVTLAPPRFMAPGALLFATGWAYPHFLDAASPWAYLYAAPTGLLPCPTLALVTGATLMLNGLDARAYGLLLGSASLFYGVTGVLQLGVMLDAVLIVGGVTLLLQAFGGRHAAEPV